MPTPCPPEALVREAVRFRAGPYRLEGELAYPEEAAPAGAVVLAGPHPLLGGSMDNNVVRALAEGLARRDRATLRFNYRGVGGSEGPRADTATHLAQFWRTSHAPDELGLHADLAAAVAFLREAVSGAPLAVVGYSFGCALLPLAQRDDAATPLVLVAPTVGTHAYDAYESVRAPKLVIAPEGDFAADEGKLRAWLGRLPPPAEVVRPCLDGHFFRGHEDWLAETVSAFLAAHGR
jgi:alpha/beta superfamily hydrolase